jgi:uncharacterized protein DUF4145
MPRRWRRQPPDEATLQWQLANDDDGQEWENPIYEGYFLTRHKDSIVPKVFRTIKPELQKLYWELVICLNDNCQLLSTIGLRALIEGICADKGITEGNLEQKINALHKFLPSLNLIDALHTFRITGNRAAHRLEALTPEDARAAFDVVEDIMNFLYDLSTDATANARTVCTVSATTSCALAEELSNKTVDTDCHFHNYEHSVFSVARDKDTLFGTLSDFICSSTRKVRTDRQESRLSNSGGQRCKILCERES